MIYPWPYDLLFSQVARVWQTTQKGGMVLIFIGGWLSNVWMQYLKIILMIKEESFVNSHVKHFIVKLGLHLCSMTSGCSFGFNHMVSV